ncbi:MAG: PASTA domain-containing protein [Actinomycetota bacterium]|nr:PASTA domain-containing protein [Actinomycetota bacterium]
MDIDRDDPADADFLLESHESFVRRHAPLVVLAGAIAIAIAIGASWELLAANSGRSAPLSTGPSTPTPLSTAVATQPAASTPPSTAPSAPPVVTPIPPIVTVRVPAVTGVDVAAASRAITAVGLVSRLVNRPDGSVAAGTVLTQSPAAGSSVRPGTTIILTIAGPPATVTVPNLVGMRLDAAEQALTRLGLFWIPARPGPASSLVTKQLPDPGTVVSAGAKVTLQVGP